MLLCTLVLSPEASPKRFKMSSTRSRSLCAGQRNSTTSSAYNDIRCWIALVEIGCSKPSSEARDTMRLRKSITKIKGIGDKGSPCRNPHRCMLTSPGIPFNITCVDEEANIPLIISHQIGPNPNFFKTSRRKGQETKSKAFEISNLRRIWGCFVDVRISQFVAQA